MLIFKNNGVPVKGGGSATTLRSSRRGLARFARAVGKPLGHFESVVGACCNCHMAFKGRDGQWFKAAVRDTDFKDVVFSHGYCLWCQPAILKNTLRFRDQLLKQLERDSRRLAKRLGVKVKEIVTHGGVRHCPICERCATAKGRRAIRVCISILKFAQVARMGLNAD